MAIHELLTALLIWALMNTRIYLPSLTVASPNGGEELTAGTTHEITWTSVGDIDNVKIEYSVNNGTDWIEIVDSTENDGSYNWEVPNNPSDAMSAKNLRCR